MVYIFIGFILIPLVFVILMIFISLTIVEILHYTIGTGINHDEKLVKISINTTATSSCLDNAFPLKAVLRGPGDRPLKHNYLSINTAVRRSHTFQPLTVLDDGHQQNEQAVRTPTASSRNYSTNLLRVSKFKGKIAEADNCNIAINHLSIGSVNDKCSTVSSGYNTATGSDFYSHPIEDKTVPVDIPPSDREELLKPKVIMSDVFGYRRTEYPVLMGNSVRLYSTKMFGSLPQHCKYMVKVRVKDESGKYRAKLVLKSTSDTNHERYIAT